MLTSLGVALGFIVVSASEARAAMYVVETSAISATTLNSNDNYCSLAEAVASINQGSPAYNCVDSEPGGFTPTIQFRQAANKPYANYHFVISNNYNNNNGLEFRNDPSPSVPRYVYVGTYEEGGTAYIDAPTAQAFLINSRVQATFYGLEITHTGTGAGRAVKNFGSMSADTCRFKNGNVSANTPGQGGALFNSQYLTLNNCVVENSSAKVGGGIYNTGTLTISSSTIWGNSTTGSGGGIYNSAGDVGIFSATIWGNSTTGSGGGIYNSVGTVSIGNFTTVSSNSTGGSGAGIYNSTGTINIDDGVISFNTATKAGGGIYNLSTANDSFGGPANGFVYMTATAIDSNSAKTGGGVFNRGLLDITGGSVTFNSVFGTGSGEICTMGQSCDGSGGGLLTMPGASTLTAVLRTRQGVSISDNTASQLGGGIYTAGIGDILGTTIARNRARTGAAIYASPQGTSYYCNVGGAQINDNAVNVLGSTRYSIVDGTLLTNDELRKCSFGGGTTATGNTAPRCNPDMVRMSTGPCPQ